MEELKPLNYQPADQTRRHRNNRRAAIAVILTVVVASGVIWGPPAFRWAEFLYSQHECLTYSNAATNTVVECGLPPNAAGTFAWLDIPNYRDFLNDGNSVPSLTSISVPIFLHERHRPDGTIRLVSFGFIGRNINGTIRLTVDVWVPTRSSGPLLVQNTSISGTAMNRTFKTLKIYAGQPDPTDPTHFTFDYEMDGTRHTVDGWLTNSDQVVISERP